MRSSLPKVLHRVAGQPLIFHLLDRVKEVAPNVPICLVVGQGKEQVMAAIQEEARYQNLDISFVTQAEQRGTGHAVSCAMKSTWGEARRKKGEFLAILPGDTPLIPSELVRRILLPLKKGSLLRIVTSQAPDPHGYGRVVRKAGKVQRIIEEKDATLKQRALREINVSIYAMDSEFLSTTLPKLGTQNAQKEYYLTDVLAVAARRPRAVEDFFWERFDDLTGINDPWELARVNRLARDRILEKHARNGVRFADPSTTWVDSTVDLGEDVEVGPGVILQGNTRIGCRSQVGAYSVLKDVVVGENVRLRVGVVAENAQIERDATLGPYSHLRPESYVGEAAKIGNFVELKKTRVGPQTSIAHLSYLGDAEVGARVNIGCGFVTCNFDGREIAGSRKHRTIIEDDVFMGSDCQTVAPVKVGRGAFVASGSTITREVEPDALAIARAHQVNKPGYGKRLRTPRK